MDNTAINTVTAVEEDMKHRTTEIGAKAVVVKPTVILHIYIGNTECVPIRVETSGPQNIATKRRWYGVTRYWSLRETATDRSGQYLLIKLM